MKTEETNKLIAEFLGLQLEENQERLFISGLGTKLINETFNKDWNWLMEVVEKIESLVSQFNIKTYTLANTYTDVIIIINSDKTIIVDLETSKIEAVYNACVTFIEWYNKQNSGG